MSTIIMENQEKKLSIYTDSNEFDKDKIKTLDLSLSQPGSLQEVPLGKSMSKEIYSNS